MNGIRIGILIIVCFVGIAVVSAPALAEPADTADNEPVGDVNTVKPQHHAGFFARLFNGVKNIVVAPLDIPCTIVRHTTASENPILSLFTGTAEGLVNGSVRIVAGATEFVSSPIPGKRHLMYERDLGERCLRQRPEP